MDLFDEPKAGDNTPEFSVSEIAGTVKRLIEGELGWVRIRGEVGRVTLARSGHLYFDLKDDRNQLSCATWKGQVKGLGIMPEEGMEVIAEGRMTAGFGSKFMLNAQRLAVAGEGALMALLEKRKKALAAEGLFDPARKKPLPYLPEIIGVVTSLQGAVIRDILHRLRDRFPRKVLIWPVAVQGERCAPDVARAIAGFNALTTGGAMPRPDLIIVARGGGSVEDLWGFNEEVVARAAAASDIPLISAVGHETDTTLIDFVSDQRAPTPTAAAELAVPVRLDLLAWVDGQGARLTRGVGLALGNRRQRLLDIARAMPRAEGLLEGPRQRLDRLDEQLGAALMNGVQRRRMRLAHHAGSLRPGTLMRRLTVSRERLTREAAQLAPRLTRALNDRRDRFQQLAARLNAAALQARTDHQQERLRDLSRQLRSAGASRVERLRAQLDAADRLRETLSYKATLKRGYAVVRADGAVVTSKADATKHATLEVEFADGTLKTGSGSKKSKSKPELSSDQGSLF